MSDTDPTASGAAAGDLTTEMSEFPAEGAGGPDDPGGPDEPGGPGDEGAEEAPWYKNPAAVGAIIVAVLLLGGLIWWLVSSDDDDTPEAEPTTTEQLVASCLAQDGEESNEACSVLAASLTEAERAELIRECDAGDEDACRLLELIEAATPTSTTTSSTTTTTAAPPTDSGGGDTIVVVPPPDPGTPEPPDPTIPELPDPTPEELVDACLADDGDTSDAACAYLADNLTDDQKAAISDQCVNGVEDACRLLERIGEDVPESSTTTTEANEASAEGADEE